MGILKKIRWKGRINRSLRSCEAQADYLCKSYAEVRLNADLTQEERLALWMITSEANTELLEKLGEVITEAADYTSREQSPCVLGIMRDAVNIVKLMNHEQKIAMNSVLNAG